MRVGLARAEASARTYPECAAISRAWRHQIMLEEQPSPAATWLHHASIERAGGGQHYLPVTVRAYTEPPQIGR